MFRIDDEEHDEPLGSFATLDTALAELSRLASTPWHERPNRAPCVGWEWCGRSWALVQVREGEPHDPRFLAFLAVSRWGPQWSIGPDAVPSEVAAIGLPLRRGRATRLQHRAQHEGCAETPSGGDAGR
jgi:hypothetical protein